MLLAPLAVAAAAVVIGVALCVGILAALLAALWIAGTDLAYVIGSAILAAAGWLQPRRE